MIPTTLRRLVPHVPSFPPNARKKFKGPRWSLAPARVHSVMVVRCKFGDVVLKPWSPK
jgi:hypothetical protein